MTRNPVHHWRRSQPPAAGYRFRWWHFLGGLLPFALMLIL